jgi:hypothetical protein
MPNYVECSAIKPLLEKLDGINKMMMYLQKENITVADTRKCFDAIIRTHPSMGFYFSTEAAIVHNPDFLKAVVKIQNNASH